MQLSLFYLLDLDNLKSQQVTAAVAEGAAEVTNAASEAVGDMSQGGGIWLMIIYIVGLVVLFYFFAIRPQKKRETELKEMQNSIGVGDWVMTSSGFYGKVADITEQVFVVEFGMNKGIRIPVKKSEIIGNKEPNLSDKTADTESSSAK